MTSDSIQDRRWPDGSCFGCGSANAKGLQIKSFPQTDGSLLARWTPGPEHSNGEGAVCGGVLGTILDCHAAATAAHALPAAAVTKQFAIEFVAPAPMQALDLVARVVDLRARSAEIEAVASAGGEACARFRGVFVIPRERAADA